jgi:ribosomal protein S27AE
MPLLYEVRLPHLEWETYCVMTAADPPSSTIDTMDGRHDIILSACKGDESFVLMSIRGSHHATTSTTRVVVLTSQPEVLARLVFHGESYERDIRGARGTCYRARWTHLNDVRTPQAFTCPCCGTVARLADDIENGYCGRCHWQTGDPELGPLHLACPHRIRKEGR